MKKTFVITAVSTIVSLTCYAHAGMYDRYLELMECIWAVIETIAISQIVTFLLIYNKFKLGRSIRKRLLLLVKFLSRNWWVNLIAAWILSSFVITPYLHFYSSQLWILALLFLFPFFVLYLIIVLWEKARRRLLSGLRAMFFYLIASIGQLIGFAVHYVSVIEWYGHLPNYTESHFGMFRYQWYLGISDGTHVLIKGMLDLSACLTIPYLLLMIYRILNISISIIRRR